MKYNGVIKKSRSLDLAAFSQLLDAAALGFLAYSPKELGVTVTAYALARTGVNILQAYLRIKTTGPVGEK